MKEAYFYTVEDGHVVCNLCPHNCRINEAKAGLCGVRRNGSGVLNSLVYGRPVCLNLDPIEKKPLYHFMPGTDVLSLGTVGCNMMCMHCQNYDIARGKPVDTEYFSPEQVVEIAESEGIGSIAYTYNEPTVFYEYMYDIASLAKKKGIKNVIVSNGYINPQPLKRLLPLLDGANIDLKSFSDDFYKRVCGARLEPVLESLKILRSTWLEATTLVIPGENDSEDEMKKISGWIRENLGPDVPLHLSAFHPAYKMMDKEPTPRETLNMAKRVAKEEGLNYVYLGNVMDNHNIYCPCGALVNDRSDRSHVCRCGREIPGVWS